MPFKKIPPNYHVWRSMKDRCLNPNAKAFPDYGARGITICDRWVGSYANFIADMGGRPPGHSLDRINNDGNYEPSNCRWATKKDQQRNRRNAVFVDIEGVRYRAIELAETAGIKTDTVVTRANLGLSLVEVMSPEKRWSTVGLALGGKANGKRQKAKTHCPHGHSYEDAIVTPEGFRRCRTCWNALQRKQAARRLAAP